MANIEAKLPKEITDKYSVANNTFLQVAKDNPKDKIEVEIGDSKQTDFLPQVKIQRWDNECNFSARLIHDELNPTVTTDKDKIVWDGVKTAVNFYDINNAEHPEGGYEFEVILKEKPATNIVSFTIQDKDVDYFYQPALTAEEIAQGASRPENVVGSYAVYAKTQKTNWTGGKEYKCGKVGHIYRPKIIDSAGTEVWGELLIENGILSVTIPQDFLDNAVYPVRHAAGLTFGWGTQQATLMSIKSAMKAVNATPASNGTIDNIKIYISNYGNSDTRIKGALYLVSSGALLSPQTAESGVLTSGTWAQVNFTSGPSIDNSTAYFITIWGNDANTFLRSVYDTGSTSNGSRSLTYGNWPDPFGNSSSTSKYSIYATYTAAGAKPQINIGDVWKTATAIKINIGDTWKAVTSMKINIGDVWKTIFTIALTISTIWKRFLQ